EDGIRAKLVTGVQTCALPICSRLGGYGRGVSRAPERAIHLAIGHRAFVRLRRGRGPGLRTFARSLGMATAACPGFLPTELGTRRSEERRVGKGQGGLVRRCSR